MSDDGHPPLPEPSQPLVVSPEGAEVAAGGSGPRGSRPVTELIEAPAMVMRIGSMVKQLLEEVRGSSLDEASRTRLRDIHTRSITELESGLAPELIEELERISLPFTDDEVPSEAELRIAQAQLVGWLEGLFHGIQTTLFAQQMQARAQFEEMRRRALPPGSDPGGAGPEQPGQPGQPDQGPTRPTGQYL